MKLREIIQNEERMLESKLVQIRTQFSHPGLKGGALESAFRELLSQYIPKRLSVGTGQIIDSDSNNTRQIDVVITNEFHPGIIDPHAPGLFFAEGVCGAGEIKTRLTSSELRSAITNCESFRSLNTKPVQSLFVGGNSPSKHNPPYFIFAMESDLSEETLIRTLNESEPQGPLSHKIGPDIVFVKGKCIIVDPRGFDKIYIKDGSGKKVESWVSQTQSESGFFDFMMLLLNVMPHVHHMENFMRLYSNIRKEEGGLTPKN